MIFLFFIRKWPPLIVIQGNLLFYQESDPTCLLSDLQDPSPPHRTTRSAVELTQDITLGTNLTTLSRIPYKAPPAYRGIVQQQAKGSIGNVAF